MRWVVDKSGGVCSEIMGDYCGRVDVETEWNLKMNWHRERTKRCHGRCRNRMEFKAGLGFSQRDIMASVDVETEWNLKTILTLRISFSGMVDVETEWNLKVIYTSTLFPIS